MSYNIDRAIEYLRDGRLLRSAWTDTDDQGREMACLLAAIVPECGTQQTSEACPAGLMPQWMASLTVFIDDRGTDEAWPRTVERYVSLLRRSYVLSESAWTRLDYRCRRVAVLEARPAVMPKPDSLAAIDVVLTLLDRAIASDMPTDAEWSIVRALAVVVARESYSAYTATYVATCQGAGADVAIAAADAADAAAEVTCGQRIIDGIFDAWEDELVRAEGGEVKPVKPVKPKKGGKA
jgi:hypothetical protein